MAYKYYFNNFRRKGRHRKNIESFNSYEFSKSMPIVLSNLAKKSQNLFVKGLLKMIYGNIIYRKKISECKTLKFNYNTQDEHIFHNLYKYNFIDEFSCLEELILSGIQLTSIEVEVLKRNIKKLEHLHTIKLINVILLDDPDVSGFLVPKKLSCLKIYNIKENLSILLKLSENIRYTHLEKLTLKYKSCDDSIELKSNLQKIIESLSCSALKTLKICIDFTPHLFNLFICKLPSFENLEHVCVFISENYLDFQNPIKELISLIKNKKTLISKIKIHTYTWDLEKFHKERELNFVGCKLHPLDLIIFGELCEQNILKNVDSIDISNNIGINDDNFAVNMTKIIKALGCRKVVMKNLNVQRKHIEKIKSLLGYERSSMPRLIRS